MPFFLPRIASMAIVILGLSTAASVYAQPIREADSTRVLEPRDPRLIPDTENYLVNILDSLGVGAPQTDSSTQAAYTPTPTLKAEQDQPVNSIATPSSTGQGTSFTTVIHNGNNKPIENIQIGSGWDGRKELRASDLPMIFDAVYEEMEHRFRNMIDSSDELGL